MTGEPASAAAGRWPNMPTTDCCGKDMPLDETMTSNVVLGDGSIDDTFTFCREGYGCDLDYPRCGYCDEPIDYCQGHGAIGDPEGFEALRREEEETYGA